MPSVSAQMPLIGSLLLLLLLPGVALLYALAATLFQMAWGEDRPLDAGVWARFCLPQLTLAVAATAVVVAGAAEPEWSMAGLAAAALPANGAAALLLRRTRREQVVGGPPPSSAAGHDMRGKVALITGGNAGIGRETALQLLRLGARRVILACRSPARAAAAREELLAALRADQSGDRSGGVSDLDAAEDRILLLPLDLSDGASVRQAAATVKQTMPRIDVLINNAGLMLGTQEWVDAGGGSGGGGRHELVMQANHLGHFLLTLLLLDHLAAEDARIVNVTSSTYVLMADARSRGRLLDDLFCVNHGGAGRPYTMFGQYAASKLANILFTRALREGRATRGRSPPPTVSAHAVHPGLVRTNFTRNLPWFMRLGNAIFARLLQTVQKTPPEGAYSTVAVASMPRDRLDALERQAGSCYWVNQRPQRLRSFAEDSHLTEGLFQLSCRLVGWEEDAAASGKQRKTQMS